MFCFSFTLINKGNAHHQSDLNHHSQPGSATVKLDPDDFIHPHQTSSAIPLQEIPIPLPVSDSETSTIDFNLLSKPALQ